VSPRSRKQLHNGVTSGLATMHPEAEEDPLDERFGLKTSIEIESLRSL
jgi:hypothetical protein